MFRVLALVGWLSAVSVVAQEKENKAETKPEVKRSELVSQHRLPNASMPAIEAFLKDRVLQVLTAKGEGDSLATISVVAVRELGDDDKAEVETLLQKEKPTDPKNPDGVKQRCFGYTPGAVMREWDLGFSRYGTLHQVRAYCHNYIVANYNRYRPVMGVGDVCNWKNLVQVYSDERMGNWDCCGYTYN